MPGVVLRIFEDEIYSNHGIARFLARYRAPDGWKHGGYNEREQLDFGCLPKEWLAHGDSPTINSQRGKPNSVPFQVSHHSVFELGMAVWANDEQIRWVMADGWFQMMYFEIRLAVSLLESKGTQLTFSVVQFPE